MIDVIFGFLFAIFPCFADRFHSSLLTPNSSLKNFSLFCTPKIIKTQYLVALKNIKNNWKKCKKIIDFSGFMLYS